jgi:hypothetical protein
MTCYGPLPEIVVEDSGDTFVDKDRLSKEACELVAIVRLQEEIVHYLPGGEMLPPTTLNSKAVAGFRVGPKT